MANPATRPVKEYCGAAELQPRDPVIAGSIGTWRVVYTVGRYGIDDSGMIRVARRFVSDWGAPQMTDPRALNYTTVSTTGNARVRAVYDPKAHVRPWQKAITIHIEDGFLREGETVTLVVGDTSGGGPGARAQTFCELRYEMKVLVDCFGTGAFVELEPAGTFEIISGTASELKLIAPMDVAVDEPFRVSLKALDPWGNTAATHQGAASVTAATPLAGLPARVVFTADQRGVVHIEGVRAGKAGTHWIEAVTDDARLRAASNAIVVQAAKPALRRFWGDLHGQSEETVGTKTVDEYFAFARDQALIDFGGHQGNCFQITRKTWEQIRATVKKYHVPGRFVTFLGYEWSGLTAGGGDRNVYFLGDDGPLHRCSHWQVADLSDASDDCYPVTELYARLKGRNDVMVIPHVGGRYADLRWHDPALEPLIEICSSWGEFEWLLADAMQQGHRVGVSCGSDDHKGRLGASYPGSGAFGVRGGLLCVFATELTREAIWRAIWNRQCYGTTGERIALRVSAGGVGMGGELGAAQPPDFQIAVDGTAEIERIELRRGMECVAACPDAAKLARSERNVRIQWSGARNRGRGRVATWHGQIECEGTAIRAAQGCAFDSPAEGITETTPQRVTWKSVTTGDSDGVVLTLDPANRGTLRFFSEITQFELALAKLGPQLVVHQAGGLGLRVSVEREPQGIGRSVTVNLRDDILPKAATPYHVMVLQRDGAKAWSSPIWVRAT